MVGGRFAQFAVTSWASSMAQPYTGVHPMKALIVDDELDIRQALGTSMKMAGCEQVDEASTGEDAVGLAMQTSYDLVTLDIRMPTVSGIDILPVMRSLLPHSVIVIMSAYIGDRLSDLDREHLDLVFQKPFSMDKITALVSDVMGIVDRRAQIRGLSEWQVQDPADRVPTVKVERVAYHDSTRRLEELERFYSEGIGLSAERGARGKEDASLFRAWPQGTEVELEFAQEDTQPERDGPVMAFHLASAEEVRAATERLGKMGFPPVPSPPPYEDGSGTAFVDPDGRRVVLVSPTRLEGSG